MKKILHIIDCMGNGGAQQIVYDYLIHNKELKNYSITVLSLDPSSGSTFDKGINENKLPVIYLNRVKSNYKINIISKILNYIRCIISILIFIRKLKPDAIHTHVSDNLKVMLIPLCFYRGFKFHTMHSDPYRFTRLQAMITKFCFHFLNVVPIAVSE